MCSEVLKATQVIVHNMASFTRKTTCEIAQVLDDDVSRETLCYKSLPAWRRERQPSGGNR
jgi:hypothetical protein